MARREAFRKIRMIHSYAVAVENKKEIKRIKSLLESRSCLDKSTKIFSDPNGTFLIPILIPQIANDDPSAFIAKLLPGEKVSVVRSTAETGSSDIGSKLAHLLRSLDPSLDDSQVDGLLKKFPKRYSVYPPLLLLPQKSLDSKEWSCFLGSLDQNYRSEIFSFILRHFSTPTNTLTHMAINKPIPETNNEIRSPSQLTTLYGDFTDFWCHTTQNGIYQTWMPAYTMFSRGNIKEKARILNSYQNITSGSDIVDMYAGIGYFTLSYLRRGARRVFCWEINPYSVEGLTRGVRENGFGEAYVIKREQHISLAKVMKARCVIFLESNVHCLERLEEIKSQVHDGDNLDLNISHINLGLLPFSTDSWPYACELIDLYGDRHSNAWIHVHENVAVTQLDTKMDSVKSELQKLSNTRKVIPVWLEKVKTFAPDVYHVVADFELEPI